MKGIHDEADLCDEDVRWEIASRSLPDIVAELAALVEDRFPQFARQLWDVHGRLCDGECGSLTESLREADHWLGAEGSSMTLSEVLRDVLEAIGASRYALIGGLAVRHYVRERPTLDVDVLVAADEAARVVRDLEAKGYASRRTGLGWRLGKEGVKADVLDARDDELFREALAHTVAAEVEGGRVGVPEVEYLVALKAKRWKARDRSDVALLVGVEGLDPERMTDLVQRHVPARLGAVRAMWELLGRRRRPSRGV